jgi:hypothetical protein
MTRFGTFILYWRFYDIEVTYSTLLNVLVSVATIFPNYC